LVYITHKFEELARIGDDVTVMRDGRVVGEAPLSNLTRDDIVRLMAGREPRDLFHRASVESGEEILRVENLSLASGQQWHGRPARGVAGASHPCPKGITGETPVPLSEQPAARLLVDRANLSVGRGEIVGLFGLVGAGRTELLEAIYGVHPDRVTGEVFVDGKPAAIGAPADAIALGIALAPEDRKRDGLVLDMGVGENASLASLASAVRHGLISPSREASHVTPFLERFRVKTPSLAQRIRNLSGGNQQKVILAKWLAARPKVLLLDEPTRGIDINAKREIYGFIDELARAGLGLIVVSSELPEILALADRVVVMCEGKITATFARAEATPERVLHAALPDLAGAGQSAA
jgi:ribose transport system ATP-binding protein